MMLGLAAIPAGIIFGLIWQQASAASAFVFAGTVSAMSVALLHWWVTPLLRRARLA